ncbi:MAG: PIN domain nuclease, partial [Actinomycetota bacterium]|nr:PIN domain nuclease [Actinomycetota bacterium]
LVDTSAWIEFLRDTGSSTCESVDELIAGKKPLATTDVVIMELLMGAPDSEARSEIWAFMNRCTMLPVRPLVDYETAAKLYVRCRQNGFTPANTNDLLVASVAIGQKVPLLAADTDFEHIAAVSPLTLDAA